MNKVTKCMRDKKRLAFIIIYRYPKVLPVYYHAIMEEEVYCTNFSVNTNTNESYLVIPDFFLHKYKTVAGSCIFLLLFPFVLFQFKFVPLRSSSVALLGAILMVLFNVLSQEDAYTIIGLRSNLMAILLLLGLMLIGEYVDREQLIARVLRRLLPPDVGFSGFLFRVCGIVFILASLFTGEGAAVMFTPVLLKCWKEHERVRSELDTLLIGVVTTANIGGASTYFGSVMLALISAKTHQSLHQRSLLDLRMCLKYLLLPAVVCFWVNYALLVLHFQVRSRRLHSCRGGCNQRGAEQEPFGIAGSSRMEAGQLPGNGYLKRDQNEELFYDSYVFREDRLAHPPTLETIIEDEVLELPESATWGLEFGSTHIYGSDGAEENTEHESGDVDGTSGTNRLRSCSASEDLTSLDVEYSAEAPQSQHSSPNNSIPSNAAANSNACGQNSDYTSIHGAVSRNSLSAYSMAEFFGVRLKPFDQESTCGSVILQVTLAVVVFVIVILLVASSSFIYFDPGLIPVGGAFALIFIDSVMNRFATSYILRRIDWSVIVVFSAIFIWMAGFNKTGVPRWVWYKLGFYHSTFDQLTSAVVLALVLIMTANTFGQVPVTIMVLDQLEPCLDQKRLVLYLAWIMSVAGNLMPYSSATGAAVSGCSSLILNYPLTLMGFLRFGIPATLLFAAVGLVIISLLLTVG